MKVSATNTEKQITEVSKLTNNSQQALLDFKLFQSLKEVILVKPMMRIIKSVVFVEGSSLLNQPIVCHLYVQNWKV